MVENLTPLIFSYHRKPILEMCKFFWVKYGKFSGKTYIATDELPDVENDKFIYVLPDPPTWGAQRHFFPIMRTALEKINTDYVMFFLEDDIFRNVKWEKINNIIKYMTRHGVDIYSFSAHSEGILHPDGGFNNPIIQDAPDLEITKKNFFTVLVDDGQRYSLQPSIWNRNSLLDVVLQTPDITGFRLDTNLDIRSSNPLVSMASNISNCDWIEESRFDINTCQIQYSEVIQHGYFVYNTGPFSHPQFDIRTKNALQFLKEYGATCEEGTVMRQFTFEDAHKGIYYD